MRSASNSALATWLTLAALTPMAASSAALNTATSSIPIDPVMPSKIIGAGS